VLQHISLLIRNQSVESPSVLLKLSDLLSYVLYEHEKESVPLENELEILKTFFMLKNALYPGVFRIHFNYQIGSGHLFISPLLLLSIVENCLDQLYQNGERPIFINMIIKTINNELHFQLECKEDTEDVGQNVAIIIACSIPWKGWKYYMKAKNPGSFHRKRITYLILVFTLSEASPS
jgi:LytS/YehU family sensor histidine kinase